MFQTFLISGGSSKSRLAKAFSLLPFIIDPQKITAIIESGESILPDVEIVVPKLSIGIEDIRIIQNHLSLKPYMFPYRTVIVKEAQLLTPEAQNAFLKLLEEPPSYCLIFLLTTNEDLLLPTIISRCRLIKLSDEDSRISDDQYKILEAEFANILSLSPGLRLEHTKLLSSNRESAINWLEQALLFFHQALIKKNSGKQNLLPVFSSLENQQLLFIIRSIEKTRQLLTKNVNVRLALDNLLVNWPKIKNP